jgi:hypothetical protein
LQVSEAGASAAQTLAGNSKVVGIDVLDTAANLQTNYTGLSGNAKCNDPVKTCSGQYYWRKQPWV